MTADVQITRTDHHAWSLRREAGKSNDVAAARRMLALALVLDGKSRTEAARSCGMDRQTLQDWVHRYNTEGLLGLSDRARAGRPPHLTAAQTAEIAKLIEAGTDLAVHGVVRWRRIDLKGEIKTRFGVDMTEQAVGALQRRLGFRKISARPAHPQGDEDARETFKKTSPIWSRKSSRDTPRASRSEIWFQDEARVGQQGTLTRLWAKRGSRPPALRDRRFDWAYIFGAVCPATGATAAFVTPKANAAIFQLHLDEIGRNVAEGSHAVLVLDGAGWHGALKLNIPDNITLLALPPYSPEPNPIENVWQYLRQNFLSNRVFEDYDAIVGACCDAWRAFIALPDVVLSVTMRAWATLNT